AVTTCPCATAWATPSWPAADPRLVRVVRSQLTVSGPGGGPTSRCGATGSVVTVCRTCHHSASRTNLSTSTATSATATTPETRARTTRTLPAPPADPGRRRPAPTSAPLPPAYRSGSAPRTPAMPRAARVRERTEGTVEVFTRWRTWDEARADLEADEIGGEIDLDGLGRAAQAA